MVYFIVQWLHDECYYESHPMFFADAAAMAEIIESTEATDIEIIEAI
jgi:hypothetical protein